MVIMHTIQLNTQQIQRTIEILNSVIHLTDEEILKDTVNTLQESLQKDLESPKPKQPESTILPWYIP